MPLPVITNVDRVALEYDTTWGEHFVNVIHVRDNPADRTPDQLAAAIESEMHGLSDENALLRQTSSAVALARISVTRLDGVSNSVVREMDPHINGVGESDPIPGQAAVLSIHTAIRGRSFRGRIYLPAVSEGNAIRGVWDAASHDDTLNAWTLFVGGLATLGSPIELGVASYRRRLFTPSDSLIGRFHLGIQRRRNTRAAA